jgi:rubrerythrin
MPKDQCQPIRDAIRKSDEAIQEAEGVLPELVGPVKQSILAFIKREKEHRRQLQAALRACEAGR